MRRRIPFPLVIILVIVAALDFLDILLASLSTDINDGDNNWSMLVLTYAIATMCMLDEDAEHDDKDITERPTKCFLELIISKKRQLCVPTSHCNIHYLMTSSSSEVFM